MKVAAKTKRFASDRLKAIALLTCLASATFFSGCTNWKKKYESQLAVSKNLEGLLLRERTEKSQLAEQSQQMIDDLQRQIAEFNRTPAEATGFGPGYDVSFDPSAGTITVTLPNTILFSSGQATLKKATSRELDHIESVLRQKYSNNRIDVVGHTDTDPIKKSKWKDNLELSAQRALTVVRYLIGRGVDNKRIRAIGCGAARPVVSNATASGKSKNRRVEIVVHVR
ncbi:MAG TPA: OmpA family protein [Planctomycetes bacterium]|nr:OmpA family protein [Planctomycetota bacterium]